MNIIEIEMKCIDEDTDQPRSEFGEESLQELMNSIEEIGLLSPIKIRKTNDARYKIIYGNRRYKACKMLGRTTIPCIVSDVTDELEIYLEQIAENLTREGFSPIEEAEAFDKLLNDAKFRSSTKFLSSKLGKPEAYIKNKCDLLKFGKAIKKMIVRGTEIKKDQLTEDQLMPIKDLPLEHRDPLAMIVARDEMPVSDVKKIAKLFKNKDIPSGTKDKLLFKSGFGLLETWSVYEQNKSERAKPETLQVTKKNVNLEENESKINVNLENIELNMPKATLIEIKLKKIGNALPEYAPLTTNIIDSYKDINAESLASFQNSLDQTIENLENYLVEWKKIRDQTH